MRSRAFLFLVVGLMYSLPAMAQDSGSLIGVVRDESRAVLPGATVTVTSPSMPGGPATVLANQQGEYRFADLPPGVYRLTAKLSGFGTYEEADLRVVAGGTTERNFTLPLATVSANITVSGQSPLVDTRRAGIVETQPVEVVEAIPLERRSNTDYVSRLPGATTSSYNAANGVNIMGSSNSEIAMTQDGAAYNSVMSGGSYPIGDVDAVQEVSVTMLGASAEFQQAQGGVLNIVNKSGMNQFRADGRYYWLDKNQTRFRLRSHATARRDRPGSNGIATTITHYTGAGPSSKTASGTSWVAPGSAGSIGTPARLLNPPTWLGTSGTTTACQER